MTNGVNISVHLEFMVGKKSKRKALLHRLICIDLNPIFEDFVDFTQKNIVFL